MDFAGGAIECFRRILLEHVKFATLRALIAALDHFNARASGFDGILFHDRIAAHTAMQARNSARLTSSAAVWITSPTLYRVHAKVIGESARVVLALVHGAPKSDVPMTAPLAHYFPAADLGLFVVNQDFDAHGLGSRL
jgi:hypothetical protein